jgi:spermidine dehydrogenase
VIVKLPPARGLAKPGFADPVSSEMEMRAHDRRLGMDRPIARRDFLNGLAITAGSIASGLLPGVVAESSANEAAAPDQRHSYPPRLTGLRGSHPGSFEVAHKLRNGDLPLQARGPAETYDLVIVGGGISGLSAAYFYRERKPSARILILDNHDDFGGHAKRNEFELGGRMELINGGTLQIDSPRPYGVVSAGLLRKLGVDPVRLDATCAKKDFYDSIGLRRGIFFDRETFGSDKLVVGVNAKPWAELLADAPLTPTVRADIARLYEAKIDYMPGLSSEQKKERLARMSYRDFLVNIAKADRGVVPVFQARTHGDWGVGIDAVGALEVWPFGFPGFQGLDLEPGAAPHMGFSASGYAATGGSYKFHFPDGNAAIARLLVRSLVPSSIPGRSAEDIVTARADYGELDRPGAPVRIRLSSTAVSVRNVGEEGSAREAEVIYSRNGTLAAARGKAAVLACWNMMIPYLCPDLPARQKDALHDLVKTPLVYTSVAIRNWRAFKALGVHQIYAPGSYHSSVRLNQTVDIGGYRSVRSPNDPILVHMVRTPCKPGLDEREQHRAGRAELMNTSFEIFERNIRDQLARTLGQGGFDPAADIIAITVNRWPHGYAYEYNPLFDPDWNEREQPHVIGRAPFGRITIANSDSGAGAYTDCAIEQAHRAIEEVIAIEG